MDKQLYCALETRIWHGKNQAYHSHEQTNHSYEHKCTTTVDMSLHEQHASVFAGLRSGRSLENGLGLIQACSISIQQCIALVSNIKSTHER